MPCSYYENRGFLGSFSPYCNKENKYINGNVYDDYCNNKYEKCAAYNQSSGGCYVTTACISSKGLSDDCYELETLRAFRDNWLKKQPEGTSQIKKYYELAPNIIHNIDKLEERDDIYESIYNRMVKPCVELIEKGEYEKARDLYMSVTEELYEAYC